MINSLPKMITDFSDIVLNVFLPVVTVKPAGKCLSLRNGFTFVERLEIGGIPQIYSSVINNFT